MSKTILLSPGPVALTDSVRSAMVVDDLGHREPEFGMLTMAINAELVGVYEETRQGYESVVLTGSGTCAVEAMLTTFAPANAETLVVANGVYGERSAAMLKCHGLPHDVLECAWTSAIDIDAVAARLRGNPKVGAVFAVHHETTTGRLNDIASLGELCRRHGKPLLLDAVSSFGAEEIRPVTWNVSALAGTSGKCLHGVPGISFVIGSHSQWEATNPAPSSVYLDLKRYHQGQASSGYSPFTQAVQVLCALREALREFRDAGGWAARQALFRERAAKIRKVMTKAEVVPLLDPNDFSCVLQSYRLPSGMSFQSLHQYFKSHGFVIYAGQGGLALDIFRIANMGEIDAADIERLCRLLSDVKWAAGRFVSNGAITQADS